VTDEKLLVAPPADLESLADATLQAPAARDVLSRRINAEPEEVEKGLAQLVLTIVELLRQLMERQALRRVEAGGLSEQQIERLGQSLMLLAERMDELKEQFGFEDGDLNLNLGPLGNLM
jgi:hypothetical protein